MIWRVRDQVAFERLARDGRRIRVSPDPAEQNAAPNRIALWCTFVSDPDAVPPRVAFAIGRAVGPAVTRNRLRRRIRAIMSDRTRAHEVPPGWYLLGARPAATELTFDQLATQIDRLLVGIRRVTGAGSRTGAVATSTLVSS